ncbi:manganese superoxide dismutase, partial [Ceratobasidium sp. AG-I]
RSALRAPARRTFAASASASVHTLPDLPYDYNALEPHISSEIMTLHHKKHHQTYVTGLNAAEEAYVKAPTPKERIALQAAIKFNGGGHINHSLFWKNLAPSGSPATKLDGGEFQQAIEKTFGSVEAFKKELNTKTAAIQGSGWGWLGYNKATKSLEIVTTANQDPLLSHTPIIGIDIWEHAFYLQYKNVKPDYLNAIWNVLNFKEAAARYKEARSS